MILAVAEASSRPLRVFCSDNWVSPLPSIIFRNPIILSSWVQRQGSGGDPRAVPDRIAASGGVCIATTCGSYPEAPCCAESISSGRSRVTVRWLCEGVDMKTPAAGSAVVSCPRRWVAHKKCSQCPIRVTRRRRAPRFLSRVATGNML